MRYAACLPLWVLFIFAMVKWSNTYLHTDSPPSHWLVFWIVAILFFAYAVWLTLFVWTRAGRAGLRP